MPVPSESYSCPACKRDGVGGQTRCTCGADLEVLCRLDELADHWFNAALAALAAGRPGLALEWLAACCKARPTDAPAHYALAKVWAQLGHVPEAEAALACARDLDPGAPELAALGDWLTARAAAAVTSHPASPNPVPARVPAPTRRAHKGKRSAKRKRRR
jgi:hypothetical protein